MDVEDPLLDLLRAQALVLSDDRDDRDVDGILAFVAVSIRPLPARPRRAYRSRSLGSRPSLIALLMFIHTVLAVSFFHESTTPFPHPLQILPGVF